MLKIVVVQDLGLNSQERKKLDKLGETAYYDDLPPTIDEWLKRCKNADIICTGKFGFKTEKLYELKNKFFSVPFVGTGFLIPEKLKESNLLVSRAPGCNKEAVSNWIIAMILNLLRELPKFINSFNMPIGIPPKETIGLPEKNITILGKGNVGFRVGKISEVLGMNVKYFMRGDNLLESVKNSDVIVDTLSLNSSTIGLLDNKFFKSLKKGSYFITVTSPRIYDVEAMLEALNSNILAGVANDCGGIQVGDVGDEFFIRMAKHPKILATPHISYNTDFTDRKANKMMIDNIEAYIAGNPINLV